MRARQRTAPIRPHVAAAQLSLQPRPSELNTFLDINAHVWGGAGGVGGSGAGSAGDAGAAAGGGTAAGGGAGGHGGECARLGCGCSVYVCHTPPPRHVMLRRRGGARRCSWRSRHGSRQSGGGGAVGSRRGKAICNLPPPPPARATQAPVWCRRSRWTTLSCCGYWARAALARCSWSACC